MKQREEVGGESQTEEAESPGAEQREAGGGNQWQDRRLRKISQERTTGLPSKKYTMYFITQSKNDV